AAVGLARKYRADRYQIRLCVGNIVIPRGGKQCFCAKEASMTGATGVLFLALSLSAVAIADAQAQVRVESFSGSGQAGFTNRHGPVGQFNRPHGLAIDGKGNIYVSDRGNHAIRVVTAFGDIRTLAGNGKEGNADGVGATASFKQPIAVAVDKSGSVYVADRDNHVIRAIDPAGKVLVVAGSPPKGPRTRRR